MPLLTYWKFVISPHFGHAWAWVATTTQNMTVNLQLSWNLIFLQKIKTKLLSLWRYWKLAISARFLHGWMCLATPDARTDGRKDVPTKWRIEVGAPLKNWGLAMYKIQQSILLCLLLSFCIIIFLQSTLITLGFMGVVRVSEVLSVNLASCISQLEDKHVRNIENCDFLKKTNVPLWEIYFGRVCKAAAPGVVRSKMCKALQNSALWLKNWICHTLINGS